MRKAVVRRQQDLWEIRRTEFQQLDADSLAALDQNAADPALSLAAKIRLGNSSWDEAFTQAREGKYQWGEVLGAVALVEDPAPTSKTAVDACHHYIRKGDASRINELWTLLLRFGDQTPAEDYLNCGRFELEQAAKEWAKKHGYRVNQGGDASTGENV